MSNALANVPAKKGKKKAIKLPGLEALEKTLPWHTEYSANAGRHAVADQDLEPGVLLLAEHPVVAVPLHRHAGSMCHRCLNPIKPPSGNKDNKVVNNPCVPRFCLACKTNDPYCNAKTQNALFPLRMKIAEMSNEQQLDPILAHLITLLDLQRAGVFGEAADANVFTATDKAVKEKTVHCSLADVDLVPALWDKKPEEWRKKVAVLTRSIHKELKALADGGSLPGYQPGSIQQLQTDAATISIHLQTINNDSAYGLFPALSVFQHSCTPNCYMLPINNLLHVRTVAPIAKGDPLTICYCNLMDDRATRQQSLKQERHLNCTCQRCAQPLTQSPDRWLEGVSCRWCEMDVMLPLTLGEENDAAAESWKDLVTKEKAKMAKAAKAKKNKKHAPHKTKAITAGDASTATADNAAAESTETDIVDPKAEDAAASDTIKAEEGAQDDDELDAAVVPPNTLFWKCSACNFAEPAHNIQRTGPGDIAEQCEAMFERAHMFFLSRQPQLLPPAEELYTEIATQMKARLPPYHHRVVDSLTPLINMNLRKGDPMKVITYSQTLYLTEKDVLGFPTVNQISCLDVLIKSIQEMVANAKNPIIKKQFEKRLKIAQTERKNVSQLLLGK